MMKSDLSFLPNNLSADPKFQLRWRRALMVINRAAQSDLDRGSAVKKKAVWAAAEQIISAAFLLRDGIDAGEFAGMVPLDEIAREVGFSDDDVQTMRRFLHLLLQHTLVAAHQEADSIPKILKKSATHRAADYTGRLCAEFGLGVPKDYASEHHLGESVSISLMRCLLIESGAAPNPSGSTLRRGTAIARESYNTLLKIQNSSIRLVGF